MMNDEFIQTKNCRIDTVSSLLKIHTAVDLLRLDLVHPVISGNKWYKLMYYLRDAVALNKKTMLTFGGAYSNHIVATAAASKQFGLKSIGIIRGEKPLQFSHSLKDALDLGMKLYFISREDYKKKMVPKEIVNEYSEDEIYQVNEGGYGTKGAEGAKEILNFAGVEEYTHLVSAVGTGTTLAGLIEASLPHQQIIGISVMKNNFSLQQEINALIAEENEKRFNLLHHYHFGGYAKHSKDLIGFMNTWFRQTNIPSDFVYTGKLFYAVNDLIDRSFFPTGSKVLLIHSGGLQGNLSLPKGTLIF